MTCPRCGLPDAYNGDGDGIGSCDCSRCDCCGAGPDDCDCRRDWEDDLDEDDGPLDPLCNDPECDWRRARSATAERLSVAQAAGARSHESEADFHARIAEEG